MLVRARVVICVVKLASSLLPTYLRLITKSNWYWYNKLERVTVILHISPLRYYFIDVADNWSSRLKISTVLLVLL